jgi:hypothetical protein
MLFPSFLPALSLALGAVFVQVGIQCFFEERSERHSTGVFPGQKRLRFFDLLHALRLDGELELIFLLEDRRLLPERSAGAGKYSTATGGSRYSGIIL